MAACEPESGGPGVGGPGSGGSTPRELVGSWYAGAGGTSVPYNPSTGAWGTPNGMGLVYVFEAGGAYTKGFQSYETTYGCTVGFTAFEEGDLDVRGDVLTTSPRTGHLVFTSSCDSSLDSDEPLTDLADEVFEWSIGPHSIDPSIDSLLLVRSDGASGEFLPLD